MTPNPERVCVRCGCIVAVSPGGECPTCGASPFALRPLPLDHERAVRPPAV